MHNDQLHEAPLSGPKHVHVYTREYAVSLDSQDSLHHLRNEFLIPSKADLKSTSLVTQGQCCPFHPKGGTNLHGREWEDR